MFHLAQNTIFGTFWFFQLAENRSSVFLDQYLGYYFEIILFLYITRVDGMSPNVLLQGLVPTRELRITNFLRITAAEETQEEKAE